MEGKLDEPRDDKLQPNKLTMDDSVRTSSKIMSPAAFSIDSLLKPELRSNNPITSEFRGTLIKPEFQSNIHETIKSEAFSFHPVEAGRVEGYGGVEGYGRMNGYVGRRAVEGVYEGVEGVEPRQVEEGGDPTADCNDDSGKQTYLKVNSSNVKINAEDILTS